MIFPAICSGHLKPQFSASTRHHLCDFCVSSFQSRSICPRDLMLQSWRQQWPICPTSHESTLAVAFHHWRRFTDCSASMSSACSRYSVTTAMVSCDALYKAWNFEKMPSTLTLPYPTPGTNPRSYGMATTTHLRSRCGSMVRLYWCRTRLQISSL